MIFSVTRRYGRVDVSPVVAPSLALGWIFLLTQVKWADTSSYHKSSVLKSLIFVEGISSPFANLDDWLTAAGENFLFFVFCFSLHINYFLIISYVVYFEICCPESNAEMRDIAKRMFCTPWIKWCWASEELSGCWAALVKSGAELALNEVVLNCREIKLC